MVVKNTEKGLSSEEDVKMQQQKNIEQKYKPEPKYVITHNVSREDQFLP